MSQCHDQAGSTAERLPFGAVELMSAVAGARRVLDAGCGSGRLTVALAQAGANVTGVDTSRERLEVAAQRATDEGAALQLVDADLNGPLPFADRAFDAVTSRLALMAVDDPVVTLRELRRVLEEGGPLATVVWASAEQNPWFAAPRAALGSVLGDSAASFARAFGRLGDPDEAAAVHREAGLREVVASVLGGCVEARHADEHWERLARDNGHFRRADARLSPTERRAVLDELALTLAPYEDGGRLLLPRAQVLVTARNPH